MNDRTFLVLVLVRPNLLVRWVRWFGRTSRFGQPNQNRTIFPNFHYFYQFLTHYFKEKIISQFSQSVDCKKIWKILFCFITSQFCSFLINFNWPKKAAIFSKNYILLSKWFGSGSVLVRWFLSWFGSVRPNQKNHGSVVHYH